MKRQTKIKYNYFSVAPKISVNPLNEEKPFELMNTVNYISNKFEDEVCDISIEEGYAWNGANIPRIFWRLIGSQYNPQYLPASLVHDWLCENRSFILKHGVRISSEIFKDILILYGVSKFKATIMASAVRAFQYTQKGWN